MSTDPKEQGAGMKLYYYRGACSLVVRIILNELGMKFEDESVDLRAKKTKAGADFLEINPKGTVPVLELDNGVFLTEVQVILQYLTDNAANQTLLPPVGELSRYQTLEWMNYISTELHKTVGFLYNPALPENFKESILIPMIMLRVAFINAHVAKSTYLMGDVFTLPDAYLYVILRWAHFFKLDLTPYTQLNHYFDRINTRVSVVAACKQEHL